MSGEVPQAAIAALLAACRSGVFERVQQQARGAPVGRAAPRHPCRSGTLPARIPLPCPQLRSLTSLPHRDAQTLNPKPQTPNPNRQVTDIIAEGYPAAQVLLQLQGEILAAPAAEGEPGAVGPRPRALACEVLAEADKCLQDGADEFVQLLHVGAQVQKVLC